MPPSSRLLYYDLGMYADDEGVVEAFTVMRQTNATEDDLRVLVSKGFVRILNEDLVTVIMDWDENNYIRGDRKRKSIYNDLLLQMRACQSSVGQLPDKCQSSDSIGKDRIGKDRIGEGRLSEDKYIVSETDTEAITEIINYLNEMTGQKYKTSSKKTKSLIRARMNEGFTVDDFKTVIYKKTKEWRGTDNAKYLRPETLFGTKFESYLNQLDTPSRTQEYDAIEEFLKGEDDESTGIW